LRQNARFVNSNDPRTQSRIVCPIASEEVFPVDVTAVALAGRIAADPMIAGEPVEQGYVRVQFDRNSICIFYKITPDGTCKAFGTGFFFMETDLVATARHIMEDHANASKPYALLVRPALSLEGYRAVQCVYHIEQDLALVKLEKAYAVVPLLPCMGTNKGFLCIGYDPPTKAIMVRSVPTFHTPDPREGKHSTTFFFEWDGPINPGNSGGPLIGSDGGVAGVLSGISRQVESSQQVASIRERARAIFIGPLTDLYHQLKGDPDSIPLIHVPFR
jgi:Trypsin-like peptidase domain